MMNQPVEQPFYLKDNFAPVSEEISESHLKVIGSIPPALNGRLLRNGPNPQTGWSDHWFFGNGMIHGVEFSNGKANWYRNRYVRTPLWDDPGADSGAAMMDLAKSAANTHVIHHAGKILALEEALFARYFLECAEIRHQTVEVIQYHHPSDPYEKVF